MTEHPNGQIMISHIPEEYSQNPEHIDHIAGNTFFKILVNLTQNPA